MKKIYLQPETMVINVNLESAMLFGSGGGDTINGGGDKGPFDPERLGRRRRGRGLLIPYSNKNIKRIIALFQGDDFLWGNIWK